MSEVFTGKREHPHNILARTTAMHIADQPTGMKPNEKPTVYVMPRGKAVILIDAHGRNRARQNRCFIFDKRGLLVGAQGLEIEADNPLEAEALALLYMLDYVTVNLNLGK